MIDRRDMIGWYCTSKQVDYIRKLSAKPTLVIVNRIRAEQGKPPVEHLYQLSRTDASEIIECLCAGTTTSP